MLAQHTRSHPHLVNKFHYIIECLFCCAFRCWQAIIRLTNDSILFIRVSAMYLSYCRKAHNSDDASTWLSILFGGISMLSKETGITVFLVNLTYDLYRCWPSLKRTIVDVHWTPESQQCYRRLSKLLISMGILLIIRLALLQGSFPKFSQQDNPTAYHPSFYVR